MLYHAGKVFEVVDGEETLVTVEMWDDNLFTFDIEDDVAPDVDEGDIVLVDYTPVPAGNDAVPRHTIVRVLEGQTAQRVWKRYRQFNSTRKNSNTSAIQPSYMG